MMKENKLRYLLNNHLPSCSTRLWSTWPFYTETVGSTGNFDYIEFVGEYSPFAQTDLENIARAAELYEMATMMKIDFRIGAISLRKQSPPAFSPSCLPITEARNKSGKRSVW